MFTKIRQFIGNVWGHTTTQLLALAVAVQPVIAAADPSLVATYPWLRWAVLGMAIAIAALRVWAPPPQSIVVKQGDSMNVDHANNLITIATAADIPASVVSKEAGAVS